MKSRSMDGTGSSHAESMSTHAATIILVSAASVDEVDAHADAGPTASGGPLVRCLDCYSRSSEREVS